MDLYFWQNMPAMHQVPYQRELSLMGHRVVLIVDSLILPERAAMGWTPEETTGLEVHVALSREAAERLLRDSSRDSIHFISGVRGVNHGGNLTLIAHRMGRRVAWINEAWDTRGVKGLLRGMIFRAESLRYRKCLDKIFAMGAMGALAYRRAGYAPATVTEFNYVVPYEPVPAASNRVRVSPFVFGYVGALIGRKRVDLLLNALGALPADAPAWVLEIHGDGPDRAALELLAKVSGLAERVRWCGGFTSAEAPVRMLGLSALVLPSDFDGWGAVVNEALLCGVPVVASDACGASCLALRYGWGRVFKAGDVTSCSEACLAVLKLPPTVDPLAVDAVIGPRATATRLLVAVSHD